MIQYRMNYVYMNSRGAKFVFGYVTVSKEQLTEDEYDTFCSYYCGLCKAIGKKVSQISRLGLSYDITFLALVLSSLENDDIVIEKSSCIAHPIKKRLKIKNSKAIDYAACTGVILSYLKLRDDFMDERNIKAFFGMIGMHRGYKKSASKYFEQSEVINKQIEILSKCEKCKCESIDEAADAFAKILEFLFVPDFIYDSKERRILSWMGYNLGRWIYIMDAYNDIEDDFKTKSYNPLLAGKDCSPDEIKAEKIHEIVLSLTFTLENIASAFELLNFKRNESLIGKIIYTSLKQKQAFILGGGKNKADGKLLKRRNNII